MFAREINLLGGTELEVEIHETPPKGWPTRHARPSKIIIDWSGNEMNADEYVDWLHKSKLGCHLFIDSDGDIHQFADLWDAKVPRAGGELDEQVIWIVLQNQGRPPADKRVLRGVFNYRFGDFRGPALGATSEQIETLLEVVQLICVSLDIPPCLPRKNEEPIEAILKPATVNAWSGILLASHTAPTASPGPGILAALDELEQALFSEDEESEDDEEDPDGEEPPPVDAEKFDADFPDLPS